MADGTVKLSDMERLWVKQSLALQKASLVRSLAKERQGSEIYQLRQREIAEVQSLMERV